MARVHRALPRSVEVTSSADVVTATATVAVWFVASANVTAQLPPAAGVTVNDALGPAADVVVTVAIDAHVVVSVNAPV
jgi:hypothetical protein